MNGAYKKPWAKEITSNQLVWTVFFLMEHHGNRCTWWEFWLKVFDFFFFLNAVKELPFKHHQKRRGMVLQRKKLTQTECLLWFFNLIWLKGPLLEIKAVSFHPYSNKWYGNIEKNTAEDFFHNPLYDEMRNFWSMLVLGQNSGQDNCLASTSTYAPTHRGWGMWLEGQSNY